MTRRGMKKLFLALCLSVVICPAAYAQEDYIQIYRFPEIEPELTLEAGYGFVAESGSRRAGKFRYLKDSPTGGGHLVAFPFPHRIYLEIDVKNKNDYFGDARYAYKDIVLSRWLNNTVYHNLDNITLVDLDPGTLTPGVLRRDVGEQYWLRSGMNKVFLRFKTPDFPFHVYFDGRFNEKRGTIQNRFLGGSGSFDSAIRVSQKRDIDWETRDLTMGLNSHLGPIEVDYSHTEKRFDSAGEKLQAEAYTAGLARPAGIFPHSLVPDTESSTDTLKIHTMYTGKIAASLTLLRTDSDNLDSKASVDYTSAAGDLKFMPFNELTFFFKYRHREREAKNPLAIPAGYLGFSSYSAAVVAGINVRPSISTTVNSFSSIARYRPLKGLTIRAGYSHESTDRTNSDVWNVPPSTSENAFSLSATARVSSKIKLEGDYKFRHTSSPAYNTQPEDAHEGGVSLTWNPFERISAFLSYYATRGESDSLVIESTVTKDRNMKNDRVVGNLTFLLRDNLTLSTGYAYIRFSVEQDNIYGLTIPAQVVFRDIRYKDTAHNFMVSTTYSPSEKLRLGAGVSHTRSRGYFGPDEVGVASFSQLKVRETVYTASAGYDLPRDWGLELDYEFTDFDDRIENAENPTFSDGEAHIVFVTLSKKW